MNSLELLQHYFRNEHVNFTGDVKQEIALQNKQSLAPFLYFVCGDKFLNVYLGSTLIQEKFFALQKEITKLFNENKIKHYFIKGSVLANLYPDPALRTRGDIDVVVQECDFERAKKILLENKYTYDGKTDKDCSLYKNSLLIELHKRLVETGFSFHDYFTDGFKHIEKINNYEYKLNDNFHFIYLVYHINKHLKLGEGLRALLDFYYMDKICDLDYLYIEKELKKLNLYKLFNTISNCLYIITNYKLPGYTKDDVRPIINYMLTNGIHGKDDLDNYQARQVLANNGSKFKYLMSKLFLNKNMRKELYPKLSKCFLFYPLIIIHRFFHLIFKSNKKLASALKADTSKISNDECFFEKYGIIKN